MTRSTSSPPPAAEYCSLRDLAQRWGIATNTASRILRRQGVPVYRFGGSIRVKRADVERFERQAAIAGEAPR